MKTLSKSMLLLIALSSIASSPNWSTTMFPSFVFVKLPSTTMPSRRACTIWIVPLLVITVPLKRNASCLIFEFCSVDSSGFSLRPPNLLPRNDEPYEPFTGPIVPFININAENDVTIQRVSGFAQWSKKSYINDHTVWYNLGVRAQHWQIDGEGLESDNHTVVSPRGQFSIKPNWNNARIIINW
mgnify:CR=1 FL=1